MTTFNSQETIVARRKIILAAQKVLAAKKVSGTRMRHIAQVAGISPGTLHYYFPSKTSLLLAVLDEMQNYFETRQKQLFSQDLDAEGKIILFSEQQRRLLQENRQVEEIFLDFWGQAMIDQDIREKTLAMYAAWRRDIHLAIEQGIQAGDFCEEQSSVAPYLFVALLEGIALQYLPDKSRLDLETVFDSINQMMIHWLRGDFASPICQESRKPYPSDMNDSQWKRVAPLLSPAKSGGRPRATNLRDIVNALLYLASWNCSWRALPHDFPGWQAVYAYHRQWKTDGTLEKIGTALGVDFSAINKTG